MSPTLDLRDKTITTYIAYQATEALRSLDEGDVLEIHTADTEAIDNNIRAWCQATGTGCCPPNPTTPAAATGSRSAPCPSADAALLVVSDAGLEQLLSPLGFALAAALEGIEVLHSETARAEPAVQPVRPPGPGQGRPRPPAGEDRRTTPST